MHLLIASSLFVLASALQTPQPGGGHSNGQVSMRVANKLTLPSASLAPPLSDEAVDDVAEATAAAYQQEDPNRQLFHDSMVQNSLGRFHRDIHMQQKERRQRGGPNSASRRQLEQCPCLVLNADYQPLSLMPLSLWSWQDAIKSVFMDRVVVVNSYPEIIRSSSFEMHAPSVIALKQFVNQGRKQPAFTRRNVFLRDAFQCQYCAERLPSHQLTFDHVVPRAHGGGTSWSNVVAACTHCNNKKSDMPINKVSKAYGMKLIREPRAPTFFDLQAQARRFPPKCLHESWRAYLGY